MQTEKILFSSSIHPIGKMATIFYSFVCLQISTLLPRSRLNILLNFKFKNERTRANMLTNKWILQW